MMTIAVLPTLRVLMSLVLFYLFSPYLYADTFELSNGKTLEGAVLDEDSTSYYLETTRGIENIIKQKVIKRNGQTVLPQVIISQGNPVENRALESPTVTVLDTNIQNLLKLQPKVKNLVAVVGACGVSQERYDYLKNQHRANSADEVFQYAIEDEMIFQEALKAGIFVRNKTLKEKIIDEYKAEKTLTGIHPQWIDQSEIDSYYAENSNQIQSPEQREIKYIYLPPSTTQKDATEQYLKAKNNPDSVNWLSARSAKKGTADGLLGLSEENLEKLFQTQKGNVLGPYSTQLGYVIVWVVGKQTAKPGSGDHNLRVKQEMIGNQKTQSYEGLISTLKKQFGNLGEDDLLLRGALREGILRSLFVYDAIINSYLTEKKQQRDKLLSGIRGQYEVKILKKVPI